MESALVRVGLVFQCAEIIYVTSVIAFIDIILQLFE